MRLPTRRLFDARHGGRFEPQICRLALASTGCAGVVERADFQRFFPQLAAPAYALEADAARVSNGTRQLVLGLQDDQHQATAAVGHGLEFADLERQDAPPRRGTGHMRGGR